jgi:hypothetical protein
MQHDQGHLRVINVAVAVVGWGQLKIPSAPPASRKSKYHGNTLCNGGAAAGV